MDDARLIQRLRRHLGAYFLSFDGTRDLGRGTAFPASADLPGGLQTSDRFFRTDLGWACYYDGTRWLTAHEYSVSLEQRVVGATGTTIIAPIRGDYSPYITRIVSEHFVATTNNGTNFWTIASRGVNAAYSAASTIDSLNTSLLTAGTWNSLERAPNTSATPANDALFDLSYATTGAPGALTVAYAIYYRLIVT